MKPRSTNTAEKLADYRRQIGELRQKMREVQAAIEPEPVKDYTFQRTDGGACGSPSYSAIRLVSARRRFLRAAAV